MTQTSHARWRFVVLAASLAAAGLVPTAGRAAPPAGDVAPAWVGRYCLASTDSRLGNALGFAAAAGSAVALARRRQA